METIRKTVGKDRIREFLKGLVNGYKYGELSAEEVCRRAEEYFGSHDMRFQGDEVLEKVAVTMFPETCRAYTDSEEDGDARKLAFWKGLKDCGEMLYRGRTFTEAIEDYRKTGSAGEDPVEYTDRYLLIEPELERLIREETGEGDYLGYCHVYWEAKKRILREKFGIRWKSPAERYPGIMFD